MGWQPILKGFHQIPYPRATLYCYTSNGHRYRRLQLNRLAAGMLPDLVVMLQDDNKYAMREAASTDAPSLIRKVTRGSHGSASMSWTGSAYAGRQIFDILPDGDLWLLLPVATGEP